MLFDSKHSAFLVVLVLLFLIGRKVGADLQERIISTNDGVEPYPGLNQQEQKRNWKQLRGSWGKRADDYDQYETANSENHLNKRGKWALLQGTWGKRSREQNQLLLKHIAEMLIKYPGFFESLETQPLKRNWAKFAGSWGKRPYIGRSVSQRNTDWSSLRGSWGKRMRK